LEFRLPFMDCDKAPAALSRGVGRAHENAIAGACPSMGNSGATAGDQFLSV
jgi:hypothetical protein